MELISLKVERETMKKADRVKEILKKHPVFKGMQVTRSSVLRQAIEAGLELMEQKYRKDLVDLGLAEEEEEEPAPRPKKKGWLGKKKKKGGEDREPPAVPF